MFGNKKYKAIFVLREGETFRVVKKRKIQVSKGVVRYKGGTYPVDLSFRTYTKKNKNFYFLNVKELNQYLLERREIPKNFKLEQIGVDGVDSRYELMSPKTLDALVSQSHFKDLFTSIVKTKPNLLLLFVGIFGGTGLGWVIRDIMTGGYF